VVREGKGQQDRLTMASGHRQNAAHVAS
jgi:hypothetical protein